MTTLEIIIAELKRQHKESHEHKDRLGLGWLQLDEKYPETTSIDGEINLIALAAAIDSQR